MSSPLEVPGLDVAGRVRARDIQMAGVADVRRRVLMVSGAIDAVDYDVSVSINLPEPGRWQIIKSETNLTDQTWVAMQVTTDEDTHFVEGGDALVMSRQFSKSFLTPDMRRLTFFDGEVRPGEAVLKVFEIETDVRRPAYAANSGPSGRTSRGPTGSGKTSAARQCWCSRDNTATSRPRGTSQVQLCRRGIMSRFMPTACRESSRMTASF